MVEVERDLWRLSGLTPLLRQGHLDLLVWDHLQVTFEYLQECRLNYLSGQPVPVLIHLHSVSQCSEGTSCVSVCAHYLLSCYWAPLKRAWFHPLYTLSSDICIH